MTRVPITTPLAVLTTRTTKEHLMATHDTTDLKPGDLVQHPEKGRGYILRNGGDGRLRVNYASQAHSSGYVTDLDLTGWERVETVRPGHVQVRVDDLDLSHWLNKPDDDNIWGESARVAIRAANAIAAQRVESTPPADEKPTNATVTLPCPDCGEAITREVRPVRMAFSRTPKWSLEFLRSPGAVGERSHACPPAQPDEPTDFGARVSVTLPDGTREKWLRSEVGTNEAWRAENGSEIGWFSATTWDNVIERGTVTIGWDE